MRRGRQSGITLIEVLVAIVVLGLLMAVGVPSFKTWIQNVQIRTATEALLNGLQVAKNEAIRRNANVQMKIEGGSGWRVNLGADPDGQPLQSRSHDEGSQNAVVVALPGGADTVTFSGLGRVVANSDGSLTMTQIDIDNTTLDPAESRDMRIVIPPGGAIRLCDPNVATAGDPRAC